MKLRNVFTITTLGITGAIGGTCLGGLVATYIFRAYSAIPNSRRWYLGNFSTVCGAQPINCLYAVDAQSM